jgi:hypothetical protein
MAMCVIVTWLGKNTSYAVSQGKDSHTFRVSMRQGEECPDIITPGTRCPCPADPHDHTRDSMSHVSKWNSY